MQKNVDNQENEWRFLVTCYMYIVTAGNEACVPVLNELLKGKFKYDWDAFPPILGLDLATREVSVPSYVLEKCIVDKK